MFVLQLALLEHLRVAFKLRKKQNKQTQISQI